VVCLSCADNTKVFFSGGSSVANEFSSSILNIASCTLDANANLATYTCVNGYIPIKYSTTPEWLGCVSCAGTSSANPPINVD